MEFTEDQFEELEQALLGAYPDEGKLKRMVRITFNEKLNTIAEGATHQERIYGLIEWSESQGKGVELIRGAHRLNPANERLRNFCNAFGGKLLKNACSENFSGLNSETIQAFTHLSLSAAPINEIVAAGRSVLPSGVSDNPSDRDHKDFINEKLVSVVRLYGLLKLILTKFTKVDGQPTLLLLARKLNDALAEKSPAKDSLVQWIQQAEAECDSSPTGLSTKPRAKQGGTLEVSLMITVRRYSKQQPDKPTRYQLNGYLFFDQIVFDQIVDVTPPRLHPKPLLALSLPEIQERLGVVCSWKQVPEYTDRYLTLAIEQLSHNLRQELGYRVYQLAIEMFLPLEYMGADVDRWVRVNSRQEPLGKEYGAIVRFYDRIENGERQNEILKAWDKLQGYLQSDGCAEPVCQHFEQVENFDRYGKSWKRLEATLKQKLGIKLCCGLPESTADLKGLFEAILYGDVPVAVWTRSTDIIDPDSDLDGGTPLNIPEALTPFLAAECFCSPIALAEKLKHVRQRAWSEDSSQKKGRCLGDHVAFLLDNPDRLPLLPPLAS